MGFGELEVVVEAVLDRGPDAELGARIELEDGLGHHVGRRVPDGPDGGRSFCRHRIPPLERDKDDEAPDGRPPVRKDLREGSRREPSRHEGSFHLPSCAFA